MISRQELEGNWKQIVGQIRDRWGQLTNDDLQQAQGSTEQLIGVIQQKTGESRRAIEDFLQQAAETGGTMYQRARDTAQDYAGRAREQYDYMSRRMRDGYGEAEHMVQNRPMESVAVMFGVGLAVGVLMSCMFRR